MTVFKSPNRLLLSSADEPESFSHYIFNWSPYLQLQNAKLHLSNFTITSAFNREKIYIYIYIGWHSYMEKTNKNKKNRKIKRKKETNKTIIIIIIIIIMVIIVYIVFNTI